MNELYKIFKDSDPLFDPPISTFEPTKKETNLENINTIPGNDICYFDCRILPEISLKDVKKQIRQWADKIELEYCVKIVLSYPQTVEAPSPTPANSPVVKALKKSLKEVLGKEAKTIGIGGGTVASFFRQAGLPAVCWSKLDDVLHGPNEYCRIDNVLSDAQIFAHIFLQK
jgi:succinyl-diaminopimelate desuccinylase